VEISTDATVYWQWGFIKINATLVYSWIVMVLLIAISWLATRRIATGMKISRWQNAMESVIVFIRTQVEDIIRYRPMVFVPFIGTLLLFVSLANFLAFIPKYHPPTGSLSTTAALAACVFFAVPYFGIRESGFKGYLKHYVEPTPFMLPFQLISEISRTVALAIRLFGNVMSGTLITAILLLVVPLFAPALMRLLELLIGQVQAYIFAVLATVYIGSGIRTHRRHTRDKSESTGEDKKERSS
jgi:F-type H+-transporting ATPase subunit a